MIFDVATPKLCYNNLILSKKSDKKLNKSCGKEVRRGVGGGGEGGKGRVCWGRREGWFVVQNPSQKLNVFL